MAKASPKLVGEVNEGQIVAAFLLCGKRVLTPIGDSARYDVVVDENGDFVRVQCKTGRVKDGAVLFNTCSIDWYKRTRRTYIGEVDVFAVRVDQLNKIYIVPISDAPSTMCSLRLYPPRNKQANGIRLGHRYEFDPKRSLRAYPI